MKVVNCIECLILQMISIHEYKYSAQDKLLFTFKLVFILFFVLSQSACTPLAALGAVGSTVSKSVAREMEADDPPPTPPINREHQLEQVAAANVNLGIAYMQRGKYQLALDKLNRAIQAKHDYAPAYNALGLLHQRLGDPDQAEKNFKQAIKLNPEDSRSLNNYGLFLCQQKQIEQANTVFLQAAENPFNNKPEIAITNAGTCAYSNGQYDEARNYFRKALEKNPKVSPALIQLAELSYDQNDYIDARQYLQRYEDVSNHTARSLWLGVRIENELGDKDKLSSYALLLRNKFPDSEEAELLRESGLR